MHYYVYIIESLVDGSFYKGFTLDFNERVKQHNEGWSNYTSRRFLGNWFI
ncbi:MAG: GIY-YIG nuclease family protein [Bacteroidetes bacterium]|nr:GIY-YIG nuclease family protein [Bacteroidota bacterium]